MVLASLRSASGVPSEVRRQRCAARLMHCRHVRPRMRQRTRGATTNPTRHGSTRCNRTPVQYAAGRGLQGLRHNGGGAQLPRAAVRCGAGLPPTHKEWTSRRSAAPFQEERSRTCMCTSRTSRHVDLLQEGGHGGWPRHRNLCRSQRTGAMTRHQCRCQKAVPHVGQGARGRL